MPSTTANVAVAWATVYRPTSSTGGDLAPDEVVFDHQFVEDGGRMAACWRQPPTADHAATPIRPRAINSGPDRRGGGIGGGPQLLAENLDQALVYNVSALTLTLVLENIPRLLWALHHVPAIVTDTEAPLAE